MQRDTPHRYRHILDGHRWQFRDLRDVMAKATPARSGDVLAGLAAGSAVERMAARMCLAAVPPIVECEVPMTVPLERGASCSFRALPCC